MTTERKTTVEEAGAVYHAWWMPTGHEEGFQAMAAAIDKLIDRRVAEALAAEQERSGDYWVKQALAARAELAATIQLQSDPAGPWIRREKYEDEISRLRKAVHESEQAHATDKQQAIDAAVAEERAIWEAGFEGTKRQHRFSMEKNIAEAVTAAYEDIKTILKTEEDRAKRNRAEGGYNAHYWKGAEESCLVVSNQLTVRQRAAEKAGTGPCPLPEGYCATCSNLSELVRDSMATSGSHFNIDVAHMGQLAVRCR